MCLYNLIKNNQIALNTINLIYLFIIGFNNNII